MQPSYALLPATSSPKTVGGMCHAKIGTHIDRVNHPLVNNQSGPERQSSMGCRHAILACSCPIIGQGN